MLSCGGEERASFGPGTAGQEPSADGGDHDDAMGSPGGNGGHAASDAAEGEPEGVNPESGPGDDGLEDDSDQEGDQQEATPDDAGDSHATTHTHCGWNGIAWYFCDHVGADPSGQYPIDCPAGLVVGGACGTLGSEGCCDDEDRNWFCTPNGKLVALECR